MKVENANFDGQIQTLQAEIDGEKEKFYTLRDQQKEKNEQFKGMFQQLVDAED